MEGGNLWRTLKLRESVSAKTVPRYLFFEQTYYLNLGQIPSTAHLCKIKERAQHLCISIVLR